MDEEKIDPTRPVRDPEKTLGRATRRLLEAAAARPDELPAKPPFLAQRALAWAHGRVRGDGVRQVGLSAWRLLPAFVALAIVLSAWAGVETTRADRESESLTAELGGVQAAAGDVLFGAALLGGPQLDTEGGEL